jgi:SAM-dependent methyltransferase
VDPSEYAKMYELERTHWWFVAKRRVAHTILRRTCGHSIRPSSSRILDAGCGTGGNFQWLDELGAAAGVDLSPEALAYCRRRGHRLLACGVLHRLPFADGAFDLVTLLDVLYHKWVKSDVQTLREVARVLRPGGIVLITDSALPFLRGPHDEAYGGARRYTRKTLREALVAAGFRVRRVSYFHFLLFPLIAAVRLTERAFSSATARSSLAPVNPVINGALKAVYGAECLLLRAASLPWGSSIVCVAERL